jgi:hypothetical protein
MRKILRYSLAIYGLLFMAGMFFFDIAEGSSSGPRMVINQPAFDFGEARHGKVLEHTFKVTNSGETVLKIQKVTSG